MIDYSKINVWSVPTISNRDYESLDVDGKKALIKKYRMIGLADEYFKGFYILVDREASPPL